LKFPVFITDAAYNKHLIQVSRFHHLVKAALTTFFLSSILGFLFSLKYLCILSYYVIFGTLTGPVSSCTRQHFPLYQIQCRAQIDTLFVQHFMLVFPKLLPYNVCF